MGGPAELIIDARLHLRNPKVLRGRKDITQFWKDMTHQVGLRDFGAFEDEGDLKPRILVVNDDEVTVQGQFKFNAIRGDFLSQTWKRVSNDDESDSNWKIKSHMFAITVAGHMRVPRNKTAIAEAL